MAVYSPDFVTGQGYYFDTDSSTYGVYADTSTTAQPMIPLPTNVYLLFQDPWRDPTTGLVPPFPVTVSMRIDWDTNTYTVVGPYGTHSGVGYTSLNGFAQVGVRSNSQWSHSDMTIGYKDAGGAWHTFTDNFASHPDGWCYEGALFPGTPFQVHGDVWIMGGLMGYPAAGVGGTADSWRIVDMSSVSPHGVYVAGTLANYGPGQSSNLGSFGSGGSYYTSMINGYNVVLPPISKWSIGQPIVSSKGR